VGVSKYITQNHIGGFQKEIHKVSKRSKTVFFNWFNETGGDLEISFLKGQCDFFAFILMPILQELKNMKLKVALEIGYGGGRLLLPATKIFKKAIGIDVHNDGQIVERELKRRGAKNFILIKNNGKKIPLKEESVDFVYSFIVLQHIGNINIFNGYLKETHRVLRKGGYAILFFGRLHSLSQGRSAKMLYCLDKLLEKIDPREYREIKTRVNCVNLKISLDYAKKQANKLGFSLIKTGISKKPPDLEKYGGQYFILLKKLTSFPINVLTFKGR